MAEAQVETQIDSILGRIVNDRWDSNWVLLREFPAFAALSWANSSPRSRGARENVSISDRVLRWAEQDPQLVRDSHFPVLAQLHHLSVFDLAVEIGSESRFPAEYQIGAFQRFIAHEPSICGQVTAALWRYYQDLTTGHCSYMFGDLDFDIRLMTSPDEFPTQIEFMGLSIPRCHARGEAPLDFAFAVEWDQEHGFHVVYHQSQVIGIGCWDDMDKITRRPTAYSTPQKWMTPDELTALANYTSSFFNGDRQHDI